MTLVVDGNLADPALRKSYPVRITVAGETIAAIEKLPGDENPALPYILPGFVDAHVHIESSMLVPAEFARLAVVHGTVATVSDPHEIANVCGMEGVEFMIANGKTVPFKFFFGAPSCVPATKFETAGATLDVKDVETLLAKPDILFLSEMMNFPGVLNNDPDVLAKIAAAKAHGKPVDGHAPGLRGEAAQTYISAGISTDHECFTLDEAVDKIERGMHVLIREGSAARNFEALWPLIDKYPDRVMFCSDDKHPDSLVNGHIDELCRRAVALGCDPYNVISTACINPVKHYALPVGQLREGEAADFIIVKDLVNFDVLRTYINGEIVADEGSTLLPATACTAINQFYCTFKKGADFVVRAAHIDNFRENIIAIKALDGQLITEKLSTYLPVRNGVLAPDLSRDILKIAVVNRYRDATPATAFINGFALKEGAIASTVAHDSHNIVAVGIDDEQIARAVNLLIECKGGVSCVGKGTEIVLPLPVGGLMSTDDGYVVAEKYAHIDHAAKALGCTLGSPFMTLSFMALLVIPSLKLSDRGLFDGDRFDFIPTIA